MAPIGEYAPSHADKIKGPQDIPKAEIVRKSRNYKFLPCPNCGKRATRYRVYHRTLHDLGNSHTERPREIEFSYSQHHCKPCDLFFCDDFTQLVLPYSRYTTPVVQMAIRVVVEDGLPYGEASWHLWRDHWVWVPAGTIQNWVEDAGKKKPARRRRRVSGRSVG